MIMNGGLIGGLMGMGGMAGITGPIKTYTGIFTTFILAIACLLVMIYAVYIGFKFMKAEDDGKRKEAKNHLIYALIGFLSISVVIGLLKLVLPTITTSISEDVTGLNEIGGLAETYEVIKDTVGLILDMICTVAVVFAVYVGWQFVKADDDGKRKQAKNQLIYTIIGIIAVVMIQVIAEIVLSALSNASIQRNV